MKIERVVRVFSVAAGLALGLLVSPVGHAAPDERGECLSCHEEIQQTRIHINHSDCSSCHTGGEQHIAAKGKQRKKSAISMPDSDSCTTCHKSDAKRMNWTFSDHHKAGLECTDCHGIHQPKEIEASPLVSSKVDEKSRQCASCHQDVATRFNMRYHHTVTEGAMSCVSCHDPHGGEQVTLADKRVDCTSCHQSLRGPHVFEHPPVAEDCATCHDPHGSPNASMLAVAQPALCLQCHSVALNRHGQSGQNSFAQPVTGAALRDCASCHSQVHGSSQDQHLRY